MFLVTAATPMDDIPIGYHKNIVLAREQCDKLIAMGHDKVHSIIGRKGARSDFSQVYGFVIWRLRQGSFKIVQVDTDWFEDHEDEEPQL